MRILNSMLAAYQPFDILKHTIILGYRGSISHGTYRPNTEPNSIDDRDLMGICVPPIRYYFGLGKFEQFDQQVDPWDVVIYEIQKYFRLMLKSNPNVLSLLWLDPSPRAVYNTMDESPYIRLTDIGKLLIRNRSIFSSKLAYNSFSGYAYGQLKKMERTRYQGYMGDKRKKLVEKFGYDTKNAAHLIRLLEMGIEFLSTGELKVWRDNHDYLTDIKDGKYSLEEIKDQADKKFSLIEKSKDESPLPDKPNYEAAELLLINIIQESLLDAIVVKNLIR